MSLTRREFVNTLKAFLAPLRINRLKKRESPKNPEHQNKQLVLLKKAKEKIIDIEIKKETYNTNLILCEIDQILGPPKTMHIDIAQLEKEADEVLKEANKLIAAKSCNTLLPVEYVNPEEKIESSQHWKFLFECLALLVTFGVNKYADFGLQHFILIAAITYFTINYKNELAPEWNAFFQPEATDTNEDKITQMTHRLKGG